jgi:EAL domain-containing protein (putative c-di-GMP-specific phosphodiesterase class I)/CheY-like chemotaxis protein
VSDEERAALIIDDDLSFGRFVASVAERSGFRPRLAAGVEEAWSAMTPDPDLILLDLNMPGVDGLEALRELATRRSNARIHVLSGTDARLLRSAAQLGRELGLRMGEPLAKPITVEALLAVFAAAARAEPRTPAQPVLEPPTVDELRLALARDELFLVFQPILELATLAPRGVEALVRWRHPTRGVVPPALFVPLAERGGLILEMTDWIFDRALAIAGRGELAWQGRPLSLSINIATGALAEGDLVARVAGLLATHAVEPKRLVLEITESAMLADRARVLEVLSRFRLRGIELSIDDFGTGTSSLERIDQLPCTELKVERSFVAEVLRRPGAESIVRSTLELARRLGLRTVAEGIEDVPTLSWLRQAGCESGQGFLFTRGLEPAELVGWLAGWDERRRELLPADAS